MKLINIILFFLLSINLLGQLPEEKLHNYKEKLKECSLKGDLSCKTSYLNKIAYLYWQNNMDSEAIYYFIELKKINEKQNNINALTTINTNIGIIYSGKNNYELSLKYFKEALKNGKKLKSKQDILTSYVNLGMIYQNKNNYVESNFNIEKAISIAKELNNKDILKNCFRILGENYQKLNKNELSYEYINKFTLLEKELQREQMKKVNSHAQKIQKEKENKEEELQESTINLKKTTKSLEKAEQLNKEQMMKIELLNKEKKIRDMEIKQKETELKNEKNIKRGLIIILFLIILFLIVLIRQFKYIKKTNKQLNIQKNKIEKQNKNISDSINYGLRIQKAILPPKNILNEFFDSFIIFKPKDIVSGDFYWISKKSKNLIYVAVVDCTGHGVPGGFMSMVGNRLLNEIIKEQKIVKPSEILEKLNKKIIETLHQKEGQNNDGMDVCLCKIEIINNKYKLTYSGAKRPLFYYNKSKEKVEIIKGDRKSIGGDLKSTENFKESEIELSKNDILYLTSDGLTDQNNYERKKYSKERLINFIKENSNFNLSQQKIKLEKELSSFMKNTKQRDDILVIGLKI